MESLIILGCSVLVFAVLGFVFWRGKGLWIIAGYKSMSENERSRIDEKKLLRIMSGGMFSCAGCLLISMAGKLLDLPVLVSAGFALLAVCLTILLILANTGAKK